jgi:methionyl-tRNA formyltransferase
MRILCFGYRVWAINIYERLKKEYPKDQVSIINGEAEFRKFDVDSFKPDIILFYGWSFIVPEILTVAYKCLMLHPSNLPKYRGGSPIQNQIIDGILDSKVTIFRMNKKLDAGDILAADSLDLRGSIYDIFERMENSGYELTKKILEENPTPIVQNDLDATYYKRRTISQSEITIDEIINKDSSYLYNKIRMLSDPYPNAYIKSKDGKKILIKLAEIHEL